MKIPVVKSAQHILKAAWMGVQKSNLPNKGSWHKWINEAFTFYTLKISF